MASPGSWRGSEGDLRVIPILIQLFDDNGSYVDETASEALWHMGEVVLEPVIAVLHDRAASVAALLWALRTLTYIHVPRSVDAMLAVLADEGVDLQVRQVDAMYMGRMRDLRAVEPLLAIAMDDNADPELRANVLHSLSELGDRRAVEPLLELLGRPDVVFLSQQAARTIAESRERARGTPGEAAVEAELVRAEAGRSLRERVLDALHSLRDPRILHVLLPMLGSEDEALRTSVPPALGSLGEVSLTPLVERLSSPEWRVREGAARALGYGEQPAAAGPLIERLREDPEGAVRASAARSLEFIRATDAAQALGAALHDEDVQVRLATAQSLWHYALIGMVGAELLPLLQDLVEHDPGTIMRTHPVRDAASRVIKEIKSKSGSSGP